MAELIGYHGTRADLKEQILRENFLPSRGDDHWLGKGAYFFEQGFSGCPKAQAKGWAICAAWDKNSRTITFTRFAVLKASIHVDEAQELLDLTTPEGLEIFEACRKELEKKIDLKKFRGKSTDQAIIDFLAQKLSFRAIRAWFFIKLEPRLRRLKLKSGIPNTTVLCVVDPDQTIKVDEISAVLEGAVENS